MSIRITHATPVYAPAWQFGGPVLSISRLCNGLKEAGQQVKVLTTNAGLDELPLEQLNKPTYYNEVEVNYFQVNNPEGAIYSNKLIQQLPQLLADTDILHLSSIWQPLGIHIQKIAYQLNVPVLQSLRGALGPYSRRKKWWKKIPYYWLQERPWLQKAAGLHLTTQQERQEIEQLGLNAPCYLLPNPIELGELRLDTKSGHEWRHRYQISLDIPVFLICGRQHHKKGLDLIPDVLQRLDQLQWHLVIVGNDDDGSGEKLTEKLNQQGLGHRITRLPSQPASTLGAIYNASDLLLLPSRHENFGNVVVEALASGCAVAVSDKTGVGGDLLRGAPANFGAVLPRESQAWLNWLATWLENPQRAGKSCAQWVARRYSSEAVANQAVAIYQQILESRQR
jgi:glycosyltransferase involved in cell wall biosynthesis